MNNGFNGFSMKVADFFLNVFCIIYYNYRA